MAIGGVVTLAEPNGNFCWRSECCAKFLSQTDINVQGSHVLWLVWATMVFRPVGLRQDRTLGFNGVCRFSWPVIKLSVSFTCPPFSGSVCVICSVDA